MNQQKRAIIIGATSGIGKAITLTLLKKGWKVGIAGRREALLADIQKTAPDAVVYQVLDVTADDAAENLDRLIGKLGGMDLFLYSSGYGFTNLSLELQIEKDTVQTNVVGFVSLIHKAFHFFREQQYGHLAAITSVAGTRGIGLAASYSATKRFQTTYLSALSQLVKREICHYCYRHTARFCKNGFYYRRLSLANGRGIRSQKNCERPEKEKKNRHRRTLQAYHLHMASAAPLFMGTLETYFFCQEISFL